MHSRNVFYLKTFSKPAKKCVTQETESGFVQTLFLGSREHNTDGELL